MTWNKDMSAAPRDGTSILILVDGTAVQASWYAASLPSHGCGCCAEDDPEPTAWMPLPEVPEA